MDGFVDEFARVVDPADPGRVMGFHPADQVPVYDFIAREFLVCDAYHSSYPGDTWVNRTLAFAGTPAIRASTGQPVTNNDMPAFSGAGTPSFFRRIDEFNATLRPGERRVDWRRYSQDIPTLPIVDPQYAPLPFNAAATGRFRTLERFFDDLATGQLPQVSWLDPNFVDVGPIGESVLTPDDELPFHASALTANDDHPPVDITHGQALLASLVFAIMGSPRWHKTLLVVTYDEHGGFYDHVPPPALSDLGLAAEGPEFATLGCRVPALVVSPWVRRGAVSGTRFDHCSLIKTILLRFCARGGRAPFVSDRVEAARHLGFVLTGDQPRFASTQQDAGTPVPGLPGQVVAALPRLPRRTTLDLLARLGDRVLVAGSRRPAPRHPRTWSATSPPPAGCCANPPRAG